MNAPRSPTATALAAAAVWSLAGRAAKAQPVLPTDLPVAFGADDVSVDTRTRAIEARGNVRVDAPPFHMQGSSLSLRRVPVGVELDGAGKVAFCPCLGTPLAVRFQSATLSPPHDLVLREPVLEVFGVPVAWAPVFWLRSPGRAGLLAPDVAWRGQDGFFAGGGVHLPWRPGDMVRGVDLRAGGYAQGGFAVEGAVRTLESSTTIRFDRLRSDSGVTVVARGATASDEQEPRSESAAWDVDALRGARAVQATTDASVAARPFDRLQADVAWLPQGWVFSSGVRATSLRGGEVTDFGAAGPVAAARRADALGRLGTADLTLEGGQVSLSGGTPTSFARAEGGALFAGRMGPLGASLAVRGTGAAADDGSRAGTNGAAQVRGAVASPFARAFGSGDTEDPWVHTTEPRLEVAGVVTRADDVLAPGRGMTTPDGGAWVLSAGWSNAIGRWGSRASAEVDVAAGLVGDRERATPSLRARAAAGGPWLALQAELARVQGAAGSGGAFTARARWGQRTGLHLTAHAEERDGVDPILARALVDAPLEPASGFLVTSGWTGGARIGVPLGARVTALGGADADLDAREVVAAVASLELHDPCGCVVVRANAAHRIGRQGVDVWVSVDLPFAGR